MNYAQHEHHDFLNASTQALGDATLQTALTRLTDTLLAGRVIAWIAPASVGE